MKNKYVFSFLMIFVFFVNAYASETENWTKYECKLNKKTTLIDGGVFKKEKRGFFSSFENNEIDNFELHLRFKSKQFRLHGALLADHTHLVNEKITNIENEDGQLFEYLNDKTKVIIDALPSLPWGENNPEVIEEKAKEKDKNIYQKYTWSINPLVDSSNHTRNITIVFYRNDGDEIDEVGQFIPEEIRLTYVRNKPRENSNPSEEFIYEYECN